jgi:hypothetical protein
LIFSFQNIFKEKLRAMIDYRQPDLTQHPPRSPRVRLGGFAHLPRLLDKARAFAAGRHGLYVYGAMMDRHFFAFTGIDAAAFLEAVKTGKSDTEMLAWVMEHLSPARTPAEIGQWSAWLEALGPGSAKGTPGSPNASPATGRIATTCAPTANISISTTTPPSAAQAEAEYESRRFKVESLVGRWQA